MAAKRQSATMHENLSAMNNAFRKLSPDNISAIRSGSTSRDMELARIVVSEFDNLLDRNLWPTRTEGKNVQ